MGILLAVLLLQAQSEGTFRDPATGEVTLVGDYSELVEHSKDPTWLVGDMTIWRGRLFSTGVREYVPAEDAWREAFVGSSMFMLRSLGSGLAMPHWSGGAVRIFDGGRPRDLVLPGGHLHTMDVAEHDGCLYVSTGSPGCGRVFRSADGGKTWTDIRRTRGDGRVLDMVSFKGRLFANERGEHLIAWDGKRWEEIPVKFPGVKERIDAKLGNAHLFVFKDKLLAVNIGMYYLFDGQKWNSKSLSFADLWVEDGEVYALTEDGHVDRSRDALNWTRVTKKGLPPGQIAGADRPGPGTLRPLQIGAIAIHRRRIFVGTSVSGRIYASPYAKTGVHTEPPQRLPANATGGRLSIDAVVPEGTTLALSYRTAATKDGFADSAWKEGAADAPADIPAGHGWMQWRVRLASDGRRTPLVRSVTIVAPRVDDGPAR